MVYIARVHVDETWLCHVDTHDGLRSTQMTRVHVFIIFSILHMVYSKYKHSIKEFKLTA